MTETQLQTQVGRREVKNIIKRVITDGQPERTYPITLPNIQKLIDRVQKAELQTKVVPLNSEEQAQVNGAVEIVMNSPELQSESLPIPADAEGVPLSRAEYLRQFEEKLRQVLAAETDRRRVLDENDPLNPGEEGMAQNTKQALNNLDQSGVDAALRLAQGLRKGTERAKAS